MSDFRGSRQFMPFLFSGGNPGAEGEDVVPDGLLAGLVEDFVAHVRVEPGLYVAVADAAHGVDGMVESTVVYKARVVLAGDEKHRHVRPARMPSRDAVGILHQREQVDKTVCGEPEVA